MSDVLSILGGIVTHGSKTGMLFVGYSCFLLTGVLLAPMASAQKPPPSKQGLSESSISGHVLDKFGNHVTGATVKLHHSGSVESVQVLTGTLGSFSFGALGSGHYSVEAEASGTKSSEIDIVVPTAPSNDIDLVLVSHADMQVQTAQSPAAAGKEIEFSDKPDFTVAGVTDWTAVGGHGSDATLRTSESMARDTFALQNPSANQRVANPLPPHEDADNTELKLRSSVAAAPRSYAANHELGMFYLRTAQYRQAVDPLQAAFEINQEKPEDEYTLALACRSLGEIEKARQHVQHALVSKDSADLHRLAGDLDEQLGDPLLAVGELRVATQMNPNEENYLAWGSELLLHRAIWQAAEVFQHGVTTFPGSAKLKTAWGTALFSGALYEEAANQLCEASDLNPSNEATYRIMGRVELASPASLPCIERRLARFVEIHPDSADANYLQAMTLLKEDRSLNRQQAERLLATAISLDPHHADACLQLGILSFDQHQYAKAIRLYTKSIEADAEQSEAHYRLALAYDRVGDAERAKQEIRVHDEIAKAQAEAIEKQRRQIKQFLVVTDNKSSPESKP